MADSQKDLGFFQALPYPYEVIPSREGGFVVFHPDLPGCDAQGETIEDAVAKLVQARSLWLRAKWESKEAIPQPLGAEPSGRLMVRVPVRLHARLDQLARRYGKSLNRLNNELLFNYVNGLPAESGLGEPRREEETHAGAGDSQYTYRLTPDPDGGMVADHPDLPGCISQGETAREAMQNLDEARRLWIETRLEDGLPVPSPLSHGHSGLLNLRISTDLHASLALDAQRNGCTLNQVLCVALAEMTGRLDNLGARHDFYSAEYAASSVLRRPLSQAGKLWERGLVEFVEGKFEEAMESFSAAYEHGLGGQATAIYRALPNPPSIEQLYKKLLPFFQRPASNRTRMAIYLLAWVESMRGNFASEEHYLGQARSLPLTIHSQATQVPVG